MFTQLIDSLVLNTVAAAAADVTLDKGNISFAGLGTVIPLRKVLKANAYIDTAYNAGQAKWMTYTFTNVDNSTSYTMSLIKTPVVAEGIQQANAAYNGTERYTIVSDASATVTEVATAFRNAILTAIAAGTSAFSTASIVAGALTVKPAVGNANFDFLITLDQTLTAAGAAIGSQSVAQALIPTSGTYAQVAAINPNATVGNTYATLSYRWYPDLGDDVLKQGNNQEGCFEVKVFVNMGDGDAQDLLDECDLIATGAATAGAAAYLGF